MTKEDEESNIRKSIKGPSLGFTDNYPKRAMWEEIAKEFEGEFKIKHDAGNVLEIHHVSIPYKKWEIRISVSDSKPLKFQIDFSASQDFKMTVSWEDFIEKIIKKFVKAEIQMGWKEFDNRYLVKTNRSELVKSVLSRDIQKTMLKHNVYSLSYQTDSKKRTAELISVIQRTSGNKEMISDLIAMFQGLIDNLLRSRVIK
jgi:hypothetical protein